MKKWQRRWNCSHIWTNEDDPRLASKGLSAFLTRERDRPSNESLYEYIDEIIDQLDAIADDEAATISHFESVLDMLYDFCDDNSIWVTPSYDAVSA